MFDNLFSDGFSSCLRATDRFYPLLQHIEKMKSIGESQLKAMIIRQSKIVFATVSVAGREIFQNFPRDSVAVVDEAAQLVEAETVILLSNPAFKHLVLVGDDLQLNSVVFSNLAKKCKYHRSLFERLKECNFPSVFLDTQYRMHPTISLWPSKVVYGGRLRDSKFVIDRPPAPWHSITALAPFKLLDLPDSSEKQDPHSKSYSNSTGVLLISSILSSFKT